MSETDTEPPSVRDSSRMDVGLRHVCFWIAAAAGAISLGSVPFAPIRPLVYPAAIFVGGVAALLFIRILFSRTYRRGIEAVNKEMQGDAPQWMAKPKKLDDEDWGLFGKRAGSPALLRLRAILFLGVLPMTLLQQWIGSDAVMLWFWGGFVSVELSLMHAALTTLPRN